MLGLHRIDLRVMAHNGRAIASYRKSGFREEGRERDSAFVEGRWIDDLIMSVLEDEYRAGAGVGRSGCSLSGLPARAT